MNIERRSETPVVFLLKVDNNVLDVYDNIGTISQAAAAYMNASPVRWQPGRPGRWFSADGRVLEIEVREVQRYVVASHPVAPPRSAAAA